MDRQAELLHLVGNLYDCTIEPSHWTGALQAVCESLGCSGIAISMQDPRKQFVAPLAHYGFTADATEALVRAAPINPLLTTGWFTDLDEPFTGIKILGREAYYTTRFYKDVLRPLDFCDAAITVIAKSSSRFGAISFAHSGSQGEWSDQQLEEVRQISPHIRRAVQISDILETRVLKDDALSATLDLLTTGVILTDEKGRIAHTNKAAADILQVGKSLRRVGDGLSARDPGATSALVAAIHEASQGTPLPPTGIAVPIASSGGETLAAWVLPLDTGLRRQWAAPMAAKVAVFIRTIGDDTGFPGELFVKHYGITPAECRVLMPFVQGMSIPEICDVLGVAEPTVKTHLARLFSKTGTTGQSQLMRLAMSALAPASTSVANGGAI